MKVLCILLCVAFASGFHTDNNGTHANKIAGGGYVRIEEVPYQAILIWFRVDYLCGATIIHKSWVITAAHCVDHRLHLSVRTGSGFRKILGTVHRVEDIILHADYVPNSKQHEIALIKLVNPIHFDNKQRPIEVAKPADIPREGELMRISGFGQTGLHAKKSDVLKAAYIPVRNQRYCESVYVPGLVTDDEFCAGNGEADFCYGDSGGPAVSHNKLYGIISFGTDCYSLLYPAVLTRVHKFHHWIEEKTGLRF